MQKSINWFFIAILTLTLSACFGLPAARPAAGSIEIAAPRSSSRKHVLVFIPGLNTKNSAFEAMARELAKRGYPAAILDLEGHADTSSADELIIRLHKELGDLHIKFPDSSFVLAGYSLGALIATNYAAAYEPQFVSALILLAPAQGMHLRNYLFYPATWLDWTGLGLRSFAPEKHRAASVTSLKSYANLFELHHRAYRLKSHYLQEIPGLLVVSKDDELISSARSHAWLERNSLSKWKFHELKEIQQGSEAPRHLIIHPDGIGDAAWESLLKLIEDFLMKIRN